jgi:hypothetical protein
MRAEGKTYKEIASRFSISVARARQIYVKQVKRRDWLLRTALINIDRVVVAYGEIHE